MKIESNIHGIIVPHAPTLLADEMGDPSSSVIVALQDSGKRMKEWGVEVIVAVTTHWQTGDKFFIDNSPLHETVLDYYDFDKNFEYDVSGHPELADLLLQAGERNLIFPKMHKHGADHAIAIPLHFMFPEKEVPVIPLSVSGSMLCAFRWGRTLGNALRNWGGKVLFLVSGSLSHDLTCFKSGKMLRKHEKFDCQVLKLLSEGKGMDILEMDQELIEIAKPEGRFRDVFMLLGVMGSQTQGYIRAYEKLPGVGMGIIEFINSGDNQSDEELLKYAPHFGVIH
ncbi:MAG: Extradiol ring-cleavage dioxygenase class protein subunit [Firmicutes bacterium]|nr:Extradiol ring-cleavage dioxygenase class protein subunit [Bacillota bacterium]